MNETHKYDDIIDLPHHRSATRKRMSLYDRAAQFAPFAALKGYDDELEEAIRVTDDEIELSDEQQAQVNAALNALKEIIRKHPTVEVCYFVKDEKKSGGKYVTVRQTAKRIDEYENKLHLSDEVIPFGNILKIEII